MKIKPWTSKTSARMIGYARSSTDKQTLYQYTDALLEAGCTKVFCDESISAVADERPALQDAKACLKPDDVFVVLSIDRAFRSTIEGLLFLDEVHKQGIEFHSIYQNMDTRTPEGRKQFIYQVADAEYELAVISRRTRDKMAAAKRRGQHLGRPFKLSKRRVLNAHRLVRTGAADMEAVARRYRVSPITIKRAFERYGLEVA